MLAKPAIREPLTDERRALLVALRRMEACKPGRGWLRNQPMHLSPRQLWYACPLSEWLAWLVMEAGLIDNQEFLLVRKQSCDSIREQFDFWRVALGLMEKSRCLHREDMLEPDDDISIVRLNLYIKPGDIRVDAELL